MSKRKKLPRKAKTHLLSRMTSRGGRTACGIHVSKNVKTWGALSQVTCRRCKAAAKRRKK